MVSNIGSSFPYPINNGVNQRSGNPSNINAEQVRENNRNSLKTENNKQEFKFEEQKTFDNSEFTPDRESDGRIKAQPRGSLLDLQV